MPQKARLQKAATFRGLSSEKFPRSATIKHRLPYGTRVSARALALFPSPRYRLRHTLSFAFYLHAATHFARQGLVQQPILRYTLYERFLFLSLYRYYVSSAGIQLTVYTCTLNASESQRVERSDVSTARHAAAAVCSRNNHAGSKR